MQYRKEIDGLRALAVISVIAFHAGVQTFQGGFVGVDIFFVISGYLITSIITTELRTEKFTLRSFYERRARRILPPLLVVILVCIPFAWAWMMPTNLMAFSKSLMAVPLFASNIVFWHDGGYFDTAAELKPLLHTWTLAVEEQYYLLFPIIMLLLRPLSLRLTRNLILLMAIASLAMAYWACAHKPLAAFYMLPTRGWEILLGAWAALGTAEVRGQPDIHLPSPLTNQLGSTLGLLLVAYAVFLFNQNTPMPGLHALIPTLGTALILRTAMPQTYVGKLLGSRVLVAIGLVSYSTYLWHQPIFAFYRLANGRVSGINIAILMLAALALGAASWKFLESPFRNRTKTSVKALILATVPLALCSVAAGAYMYQTSASRLSKLAPIKSDEFQKINTCYLLESEADAIDSKQCGISSTGGKKYKVLLLGDSHAATLYPGLKEYLAAHDVSLGMVSAAYCLPLVLEFPRHDTLVTTERCAKINNRIDQIISSEKFDLIVVSSYIYEWGFKNAMEWSYPSYYSDYLKRIQAISRKTRTTIVGQFPIWPDGLPDILATEIGVHGSLQAAATYSKHGLDPRIFAIDQQLQTDVARQGADYISIISHSCIDQSCRRYLLSEGRTQLVAFDYGHLSLAASRHVGGTIVGPAIVSILTRH